jgi:hypothetical protein
VTGLEPATFEVERFELGDNACLELRGRWFGVRGRRFMRPALTSLADGQEQRILAALDHKPWNAEDGEAWLAVFPYLNDPAALARPELTVAPDVTVPLPPPSTPQARRRPSKRAARPSDRDAALRSRDQALSELDAAKREHERLRRELRDALQQREAEIAARHDAVEAEVALRIESLRAEAERDRAAARLAAQTARERDDARAARDDAARERDEAARERDEARADRDDAQRSRNRMLAERDTARAGVERVTRRWEQTAALGTHRTMERDALVVERDRLARERDVALAKVDALVGERDTVLGEVDRLVGERDSAVEARDRSARERDRERQERDRLARERDSARERRDQIARERGATAALDEPRTDGRPLASRQPEPLESDMPTAVVPLAPRPQRARTPPGPGALATGAPFTSSAGRPTATQDPAEIWRTRVLAITALLVAVVVVAVLLLAK